MDYQKHTTINGVADADVEIVSREYVENFTSKDTLAFFRSLGGTEKVTRFRDGRITILSESPDKDISRFVEFTPLT